MEISSSGLNLTLKFSYGTKASGLYSFIPSGPAKPVNDIDVTIAIVEGRLWSYVDVVYSTVRHRVAIYNHDGNTTGISIHGFSRRN